MVVKKKYFKVRFVNGKFTIDNENQDTNKLTIAYFVHPNKVELINLVDIHWNDEKGFIFNDNTNIKEYVSLTEEDLLKKGLRVYKVAKCELRVVDQR